MSFISIFDVRCNKFIYTLVEETLVIFNKYIKFYKLLHVNFKINLTFLLITKYQVDPLM